MQYAALNTISRLIALSLAGITSVSAVPLMQLIVDQNDKLMAKVGVWKKECAGKPYYDQDCMKRRYKLCGELGEFVALATDEIVALKNVSPDASASDKGEFEARRKSIEHLIHVALNNIKCLGRSGDSHCGAESTADITKSTRSEKKDCRCLSYSNGGVNHSRWGRTHNHPQQQSLSNQGYFHNRGILSCEQKVGPTGAYSGCIFGGPDHAWPRV